MRAPRLPEEGRGLPRKTPLGGTRDQHPEVSSPPGQRLADAMAWPGVRGKRQSCLGRRTLGVGELGERMARDPWLSLPPGELMG